MYKRQPQYEQELYDILDTSTGMDCLIVSGSVPPRASKDFLDQVMEHAQERGADVVLDLSSDKLKTLASKKPLLIKPNHHEMREIFGVPVNTDDEVRVAAFLLKWYKDRDNVEEAMKLAMATGANVAESVGLGDFGRVDEYSKRVTVRKLERK